MNSSRTSAQFSINSTASGSSFFQFYTSSTVGGAPTERMRMAGGLSIGNSYVSSDPGAGNVIVSGSVGIGTTTPATALDVRTSGSTTGVASVVNVNDSGGYGSRLQLYDSATSSAAVDGTNGLALIFTASSAANPANCWCNLKSGN